MSNSLQSFMESLVSYINLKHRVRCCSQFRQSLHTCSGYRARDIPLGKLYCKHNPHLGSIINFPPPTLKQFAQQFSSRRDNLPKHCLWRCALKALAIMTNNELNENEGNHTRCLLLLIEMTATVELFNRFEMVPRLINNNLTQLVFSLHCGSFKTHCVYFTQEFRWPELVVAVCFGTFILA